MEGILPIPNDDEDYLDYVDVITEGGDPYGPFTGVYIDTSQITFDNEIILKGVNFNNVITEFSDFTFNSGNINLDSNNSIIIIEDQSTRYLIEFRYNMNESAQTVIKSGSYYYKIFNSVYSAPFIVDNENDNILGLTDTINNDNYSSKTFIYKKIFSINFNS